MNKTVAESVKLAADVVAAAKDIKIWELERESAEARRGKESSVEEVRRQLTFQVFKAFHDLLLAQDITVYFLAVDNARFHAGFPLPHSPTDGVLRSSNVLQHRGLPSPPAPLENLIP